MMTNLSLWSFFGPTARAFFWVGLPFVSFSVICIFVPMDASIKSSPNSPCAACKLLRRRCAKDCIFAPYFPAEEPHKFASVHRIFGASNVNKMLQELPVHQRGDAVSSLVYEANARTRDPIYGCVGAISYLQQQMVDLQTQLAVAQAEILYLHMHQQALLASIVGKQQMRQKQDNSPSHDISPAATSTSSQSEEEMKNPELSIVDDKMMELKELLWT